MVPCTMVSMEYHEQHAEKRKTHARILGPGSPVRPLWVYDEDDWAQMNDPASKLVCPRSGCSMRFTKPRTNDGGTRWLSQWPGETCDHAMPRPAGACGGGGLMSAQHRWLEARLARVCEVLGYEAIPEHYPTFADVFVTEPEYCLEVQQWSTEFTARTKARTDKGAKVLWLLTDDATSRKATEALFTLPAVRLKVVAKNDWSRQLSPWDDSRENAEARLIVWGTVATHRFPTGGFRTAPMGAARFLKETFEGNRVWVPPHPRRQGRGSNRGVWALQSDVRAETVARWTGIQASLERLNSQAPIRPALQAAVPPKNEPVSEAPIEAPVAESRATPIDMLQTPNPPVLEPPSPAQAKPKSSRWWLRRLLGWLIEE